MTKVAKKRPGIKVYLISLFAIILWSMSYLWSDRLIHLQIPVEFFIFVRILLAGLILLVYNLIRGYHIKIKKKHLGFFLLLSFFEPFIYFVCETHGIELTESPTFSALIIATAPIFSVASGRIFFKEKISFINVIGIMICLSGIAMVTMTHESLADTFMLGLILLLIAILAEVGHATVTKYIADDYKPEVIVMYQFLFGSVMLSPLFFTKGIQNFDAATYLSWDSISAILCLAVFCSSLAFSLWVNTIKELGVAKSSIFMAVIPVFTAIDGWILGQEILTLGQWCGIAIACLGVILSQCVFKKPKFNQVINI